MARGGARLVVKAIADRELGGARLTLFQGDLTLAEVDAIVNAANSSLLGGGGVDGAIHRRGGPAILEECRRIRATTWPDGLPAGEAVITTGGRLAARHVIHTVGPVWGRTPDAPRLLACCHERSLEVAGRHALRRVAFPAVSTGAYGAPLDEAAPVALGVAARVLAVSPGAFDEVRFVLFDADAVAAFRSALARLA